MKPDDFRRLVAAGLTSEQVAVVMEMFDARDEDRKASQRARWRKHQENKRNANVSQREQTLANVPRDRDTRGEDNSLPQKIEPQESKKEQSAQARLMEVLDPVRAKAVVDHRRAIRKALSPYAADLLAKKLAKCADPNQAVDTMIERGWQTVYPDAAPQARGSPPKPNPALAAADALMEKFDAVSPSPTETNPPYPRLVAFSGGG